MFSPTAEGEPVSIPLYGDIEENAAVLGKEPSSIRSDTTHTECGRITPEYVHQ